MLPASSPPAASPSPSDGRPPALLLTPTLLHRLRTARDPFTDALLTFIVAESEALLSASPARPDFDGHRMLAQSRLVLKRVTHLGLAGCVTRDPRFLRRVEDELLAAAAFPTWNPPHFLDVGEMAAALALGYAWLHDDLAPSTRAAIREALIEKALRPGLLVNAGNWWHTDPNNWNQVCFGGLILAALVVRGTDPEATALADSVLAFARPRLRHGLAPYAPDGVYPEGPSYWVFGTSYSVLTASALRTALGDDFGIPAAPGFLASADFVNAVQSPAGEWFNYGDCRSSEGERAALFWFAAETARPALAAREEQSLLRLFRTTPPDPAGWARRFLPLALLWRTTATTTSASPASPATPLHWHGAGPAPLATHRQGSHPRAAFVGIKGGSGRVSHGHLDAGSFVYDVHGQRWALDPGMEDYGPIERRGLRLWSIAQDSDRWRILRLSNLGHNTLSLGGELHRADGFAPLAAFSAAPDHAFTVVDLTSVFQTPGPASAHRGVRLFPDGQLLVADSLRGLAPHRTPVWQMLTAARVEPTPDGALLHRDGETIRLRLLASSTVGATRPLAFEVVPADSLRADFDSPLPGVCVLRFTVPLDADATLYGVLFQPVPDAAPAATFATLTDPATWTPHAS